MSPYRADSELQLAHRRLTPEDQHHPYFVAGQHPTGPRPPRPNPWPSRILRTLAFGLPLLVVLAFASYFYARHWVRSAVVDSLPQLDGSARIPGLAAPVTVIRDSHGVPHIEAQSVDDLVLAQGSVTAQDRLFQMDTLRRHAAGTLAAVFGAQLIGHDKLQRALQVRAAADRAIAVLPPDQLHLLEQYAKGVNASIAAQRGHLPIEFRVLGYKPEPWTPRDSILVQLAMFQDLTNRFTDKLARETLTQHLPPELASDLYPVGSWRDHPPAQPVSDLTIPGPPIEQVPLDESQSRLEQPERPGARPSAVPTPGLDAAEQIPTEAQILTSISPILHPLDPGLTAGSNNWVVSGAHTASGKPLLSNDMHLAITMPGIWYEADLSAGEFHVAGVSIPGTPLICVGHNAHIAWGFTNLGADVQDLYVETTRNNREFLATDGSWQPLVRLDEKIEVHHGMNVSLEVLATRHGDAVTPILNQVVTPDALQNRTLSLRWTIYDPANLQFPWFQVNSAHDWPGFLAAFQTFGGPAQNAVYADDQGHIGYHALGRIPLRGTGTTSVANLPNDLAAPDAGAATQDTIARTPSPLARTDVQAPAQITSSPLSPVPLIPTQAHEWSGYIPFDQLPQVYDPPTGVLATANARVAPDEYPYAITLNWASPYRNERIWKLLGHSHGLTPADMLSIQTDVYSDFDHVLAQRLAYALDHTPHLTPRQQQAADLLRTFNGRMNTDSAAATVVSAVHAVLWPMLLRPHLGKVTDDQINSLYTWGERDYALEQLLMHTPPRWLPQGFSNWDAFLSAAVDHGLTEAKAPADLSRWAYGPLHQVDIENPIFDRSEALRKLLARPTGTGPRPQSGDATTIKQVGRQSNPFGPSERFTADLGNPDNSTLNLVLGQSANPASPWFLDHFNPWLRGTTFPFPFTPGAVQAAHTLTLTP